ncbi:cysteine desulfurase [Alicyclobacillus cellulosilyticus]|uniref:Cysteine desulfurase n=1 Tax=Alicyclobacillus cellulosilyticus TaxID=1003997 RepID=A0A917NGW6_9BACL|nr:cysteine desulfurase family protein [Alicyclobacillus cellulosilyticus]GGI97028.1 cysteine desulfurase [Alicyclobacillus cellulosilyticus]
MAGRELYFDTAATTPLLPEVREALVAAFDNYGNPSSLHRKGVEAERAMASARAEVARCLGVEGGSVIFTGCGTEANNLAIFGTAWRHRDRGRHIVTTQIEHPSVLEPVRWLERQGWTVTYVPPQPDGSVRADDVLAAVRDDTVLVSMMHINNETGAILPVAEVARGLKARRKVVFHVDGIQAFGKVPACAKEAGADLYTVSGHKIGAPKGIGALYIRQGLRIDPVLHGGGQEQGLRSGTENVLGIIALGVASAVARQHAEARWQHVLRLADRLCAGLADVPGAVLQRPPVASPYIVSVTFPGLRGEVMVHALEEQGLYVSTGSACSTKGQHATASHVLRAMGKRPDEVTGTLRFSLGWWHTEDDVDAALAVVKERIGWLRSLW